MRKTKIFSVSVLSSFVNPRSGTIVSDQDPAKPGVGSKIPIKKAWISSSLMKSKLWKGVSSNFFFFCKPQVCCNQCFGSGSAWIQQNMKEQISQNVISL